MKKYILAASTTLAMAGIVIAQTGILRLEARLQGAGLAEGKAKYKNAQRGPRALQQELEFEGEDLRPNTPYILMLNGTTVVGKVMTDEFGSFAFEDRSVGTVRWTVRAGDTAQIVAPDGFTISGVFNVQ